MNQNLAEVYASPFRSAEAYLVSTLESDEMVRARAARFIGSVAVSETIAANREHPFRHFNDAVKAAAAGDELARTMVRANVSTDLIERTIKTGMVMSKSALCIGEGGELYQHGQSYLDVQANSLERMNDNEVMRRRTEAETLNAFRLEHLDRLGAFEEYSFLVFSLAEYLPDYGFFTQTLSCSIQLTSKSKTANQLETECAMVAGIDEQAKRLDYEKTREIYLALTGLDIKDMSTAEIINNPILIHDSLIPNGVVDVVKLYDHAASSKTFFGLNRIQQDYLEFKQECLRREIGYEEQINRVMAELLEAASAFVQPLEAVEALNRLSEKQAVTKAIYDEGFIIDPLVFGIMSAGHILNARQALEEGDFHRATAEAGQAVKTALSYSCPGSRTGPRRDNPITDETSKLKIAEGDEHGSLVFYCQKGHRNERPRHELLDKCKTCGIDVSCKKPDKKHKDKPKLRKSSILKVK